MGLLIMRNSGSTIIYNVLIWHDANINYNICMVVASNIIITIINSTAQTIHLCKKGRINDFSDCINQNIIIPMYKTRALIVR